MSLRTNVQSTLFTVLSLPEWFSDYFNTNESRFATGYHRFQSPSHRHHPYLISELHSVVDTDLPFTPKALWKTDRHLDSSIKFHSSRYLSIITLLLSCFFQSVPELAAARAQKANRAWLQLSNCTKDCEPISTIGSALSWLKPPYQSIPELPNLFCHQWRIRFSSQSPHCF